jgi:DNA (cytosine-5)-methyltransferase 1
MTRALYNEIEPFAAAWMRELMANGHIAHGVVDERSISDLTPADVAGPGQRHFFAGIGGWSCALRLAGVSDDSDIWTGSCPCQPFSSAGKRGGTSDARHLWPAWFALIEQCRPAIILGEQVASRDGLTWLDLVFADLERCGYAVGAADLCAAGVGAPHIRQRLYFVAYADEGNVGKRVHVQPRQSRREMPDVDRRGTDGELADRKRNGLEGRKQARSASRAVVRSGDSPMGNAGCYRDLKHARELPRDEGEHAVGAAHGDHPSVATSAARGDWTDVDWLPCADGVSRPVEPGTFPLAHGVPARVGRLRGYGNAIVPQVAATFIRAALGAMP